MASSASSKAVAAFFSATLDKERLVHEFQIDVEDRDMQSDAGTPVIGREARG